jgi:hypothetical protein
MDIAATANRRFEEASLGTANNLSGVAAGRNGSPSPICALNAEAGPRTSRFIQVLPHIRPNKYNENEVLWRKWVPAASS